MGFTLHIADRQRTGLCSFLRKHLPAIHALLRSPLDELSVALVGAADSARLHLQFMHLPGPTDVLTFELEHDAKNRVTSGEIVICVPFARRMARAHRVPLRNELLLYCLHGMLHLTGYDDKTQRGFDRMHRKEDEILETLGIGTVFKPPPTPNRRSKGLDQ